MDLFLVHLFLPNLVTQVTSLVTSGAFCVSKHFYYKVWTSISELKRERKKKKRKRERDISMSHVNENIQIELFKSHFHLSV